MRVDGVFVPRPFKRHVNLANQQLYILNIHLHLSLVESRHCRCDFGRVEVADALQPPDQLEIVVSRFRFDPPGGGLDFLFLLFSLHLVISERKRKRRQHYDLVVFRASNPRFNLLW
jgi:hypothetical protein